MAKNITQLLRRNIQQQQFSKPNELANFTANFEAKMARFVRVKIESNLVNPAWHPAPGAPCWLFVDEITIE